MTNASNVTDMDGTPVLPTYDPDWEERFDRHIAESKRLNEVAVPHCFTEEHGEKVRRAAEAWQDAFHAQFRTLPDYLAFTKGWSVHCSHAGRMIPWPELEADATVNDVHRTVGELEELTKRVSDAEYGLERSAEPFGVLDAEPADGFERHVYKLEWLRDPFCSPADFPLIVVEDRNERERHIGLIRPLGNNGPVPFEEHLGRIACEVLLGEGWGEHSWSWRDWWHARGGRNGVLRAIRAFVVAPTVRFYVHYGPNLRCRSTPMTVYEMHRCRNGFSVRRETSAEAMPGGLVEALIASDPEVMEALEQPVWSEEAWDAFHLKSQKQSN